jgi:serine protease inhibitor
MRRSIAIIALATALSTPTGAVLAQSNDAPPALSPPAPSTSAPSAPSTPDSVAPNKETRAAIATAQAKLAWQLIKDAAPGVDPTISPAGLASVFSVLSDGADAKMKNAIVKAMGFESSDAKLGLAALSAARQNATAADPAVFVSKDLIVFAPTAQPSPIFLAGLGALNVQYYVDDLSKMEAVKKIDGWVNDTTKGAIPEILGQPLEKADLVALNALHFKAKWATTFDPKATVETPFTSADKKSDKVMMMRLPEAQQSFRQEKDLIAVDLPFAGDRFSLIVVTSTKAPKTAKEFSEAATWLSGEGFGLHKGDISLPRFSLQASSSLLPTLEKAGLGDGLKSPTALAAFGAGAKLTQVAQRAMIDVDEEGAEAAAATAVIVGRSLEIDDAYHMVVDKPFLFALRDRQSGLILVAGYVGHAPKGKAA